MTKKYPSAYSVSVFTQKYKTIAPYTLQILNRQLKNMFVKQCFIQEYQTDAAQMFPVPNFFIIINVICARES